MNEKQQQQQQKKTEGTPLPSQFILTHIFIIIIITIIIITIVPVDALALVCLGAFFLTAMPAPDFVCTLDLTCGSFSLGFTAGFGFTAATCLDLVTCFFVSTLACLDFGWSESSLLLQVQPQTQR